MNTRTERIMKALEERGLSQMLVVDPMSIYYMTGVYIEPHERFYGLLLRKNGGHVLFLNNLFTIPDGVELEKVWYSDTDPAMDYVMKYIDPNCRLGVDKDIKAGFLLPLMDNHAATGFENASLAVDVTRGIKDEEEKEKMRAASKINDQAMARFRELVKEGITEKEIADQTLEIYKELGAEGFSFDPIVSFGANAADPHHMPDDTVLKAGDVIIPQAYSPDDGTFYFELPDGTAGNLLVDLSPDGSEGQMTYSGTIGGVDENELFENRPYAG